jgi:hypothetical protein
MGGSCWHKKAWGLERYRLCDRDIARGRGGEVTLPRPALATETLAKAEHAVLDLAALLDAEVRVTEIILQALQARIVSLKVVRLGWLLVTGWVR